MSVCVCVSACVFVCACLCMRGAESSQVCESDVNFFFNMKPFHAYLLSFESL